MSYPVSGTMSHNKGDTVNTQYLGFNFWDFSESGKTWIIQVKSKSMGTGVLGIVSWFGSWRKYVFQPGGSTVFDAGCLREIADFTESLTREHKSSKERGAKTNE